VPLGVSGAGGRARRMEEYKMKPVMRLLTRCETSASSTQRHKDAKKDNELICLDYETRQPAALS
jgi:hypothetical protein